jgi:hypothetical protein
MAEKQKNDLEARTADEIRASHPRMQDLSDAEVRSECRDTMTWELTRAGIAMRDFGNILRNTFTEP